MAHTDTDSIQDTRTVEELLAELEEELMVAGVHPDQAGNDVGGVQAARDALLAG